MNIKITSYYSRKHRQRGVALFVVIVFVMLSMLLALWASRTAIFNEMVVGNDADYQRAFESAQALLQDAEQDILLDSGMDPICRGTPTKVCRKGSITKVPLEKQGPDGVDALLTGLATTTPRCADGLCAKRLGRQDFWNFRSTDNPQPSAIKSYEINLDTLSQDGIGARYGEFTGATVSDNPILTDRSAWNRGGWYWIEVLPYDESSHNSGLIVDETSGAATMNILPLNITPSIVYRITSVAYGRKTRAPNTGETGPQPVTVAVLQETYARQKLRD